MATEQFESFKKLLSEPKYFKSFLGLSAVLVGPGHIEEWSGRGFYATLASGGLKREDSDGPEGEAVALLQRFLEVEPLYSSSEELPLKKTVRLLLSLELDDEKEILPYPAYVPQYTAQQVVETLELFLELLGPDDVRKPGPGLRGKVRERILESGDKQYAMVARSCASLWYAAALIDLSAPEGSDTRPGHIATRASGFIVKCAPIQTYGSALIWKAIGSTAPGLPGSYYGNWAYPPPQPAVPPSSQTRGK